MVNKPIEFNNADNYERFMGVWSRSAGELFLDWLAPKKVCVGLMSAAAVEPLPIPFYNVACPLVLLELIPQKTSLSLQVKRNTATYVNFRSEVLRICPLMTIALT